MYKINVDRKVMKLPLMSLQSYQNGKKVALRTVKTIVIHLNETEQ